MVSILGDYSYTFPRKQELKIRLKDLLEDNVPEKYFLSEAMVKYITADNDKWSGNNSEAIINKDYASTLNTNEGSRRCDASNYICNEVGGGTTLSNTSSVPSFEVVDSYNKCLTNPDYAGTITSGQGRNQGSMILIKNATAKGYLEATEGDGIDISGRMQTHRGTVQKGKVQTLTSGGGTI